VRAFGALTKNESRETGTLVIDRTERTTERDYDVTTFKASGEMIKGPHYLSLTPGCLPLVNFTPAFSSAF
jgi:hypothetical protein